jgi:hypothetical protein
MKHIHTFESFINEAELKSVTNKHGVTFNIGDIAKTPDKFNKTEPTIKIIGFFKGKDGHMKATYSKGTFLDVFNVDDLEK